MIMSSVLVCWALTAAAPADRPAVLFEQAEQLSHGNQKPEALDKVQEAVAEIDRLRAAGEDISWQGYNGLRFAARLAREDFLDFEQSLRFCDKLFELADSDYWRVPARLERASTYRAMGDFARAQREYDAIAEADQRQRSTAILPQAEMVYFEMGDEPRGRALIDAALKNESLPGRERFQTLRKCAQQAITQGRLDQALEWYARVEELPYSKPEERAGHLSQTWYEMGQIQESRGRAAEAKTLYRRALELQDGDLRFRTRARDALEAIEYFE